MIFAVVSLIAHFVREFFDNMNSQPPDFDFPGINRDAGFSFVEWIERQAAVFNIYDQSILSHLKGELN